MLMQNDDLGREIQKGLQEGLSKQSKAKLVAQATFEVTDPAVDSQLIQLKASGADVLVIAATSRTAVQVIRKTAEIGWKVERYMTYAAAAGKMTFEPAGLENSKAVIGLQAYKDAMSPRWSSDPESLEYREFLRKNASSVDPASATAAAGYIVAQLMAHVLREAGDDLTRENVHRQASNLKNPRIAMLLPGVRIENSPADLFATASLQPVRFDGVDLENIGPVLSTK